MILVFLSLCTIVVYTSLLNEWREKNIKRGNWKGLQRERERGESGGGDDIYERVVSRGKRVEAQNLRATTDKSGYTTLCPSFSL